MSVQWARLFCGSSWWPLKCRYACAVNCITLRVFAEAPRDRFLNMSTLDTQEKNINL
jgi:hypothetical protein